MNYNSDRLIYLPLKANGWQSIFYDYLSILHAILHSDTILVLGVSGCTIIPIIKIFIKRKFIINIDGLEWKRDKWNFISKFILKVSEIFAIKFADIIITDNKHIQDYVKFNYNKDSELIEYGGDNSLNYTSVRDVIVKNIIPFDKYALFTCRIEPENNIHIILEAFSNSHSINLVGIGNWKGSKYGRKLRNLYSSSENIVLLEYISDQELLNYIKSKSYIYIHGHSAGGTNPSLVEAMYLGLPIIAYDVPYNRETTNNKADYFSDSEDLLITLLSINNDYLISNAASMKIIAEERYKWKLITEKYESTYL